MSLYSSHTNLFIYSRTERNVMRRGKLSKPKLAWPVYIQNKLSEGALLQRKRNQTYTNYRLDVSIFQHISDN
jgi:hypothetical protein